MTDVCYSVAVDVADRPAVATASARYGVDVGRRARPSVAVGAPARPSVAARVVCAEHEGGNGGNGGVGDDWLDRVVWAFDPAVVPGSSWAAGQSVGMRWRAVTAGTILGLSYWEPPGANAARGRVFRVWSATPGNALGEQIIGRIDAGMLAADGWLRLPLAAPVHVDAGAEFMAVAEQLTSGWTGTTTVDQVSVNPALQMVGRVWRGSTGTELPPSDTTAGTWRAFFVDVGWEPA